ncbi:hypothetical protein [Alkalibacterium sp. MB6]|uniref:hypothetical protein n=1 Tax=Alkalibacterium sp. MB6 TaxID=2081965 RepID=UPI00137AF45F|nr:hypothetical protein [Alkalibacterium sp. MB6]
MTRETKKTLMTGMALFLAGVVSLFTKVNDDGLFAFILLAYGAWELGEVISDYFCSDVAEEEEEERSSKDLMNEFKLDTIRISIPMFLSMLVEIVMIGTGFRLFTLLAYVVTLLIYILFIGLFALYEYKRFYVK